ncbi:6-pyruvoyl-tetrahydropterin synthase related domain [Pleurocapsa sp. PCC 7327]|nr:6-pyruvoyl-tetrahydropterin synthase related domain [Pleurocapsa sp. PCC 7327]
MLKVLSRIVRFPPHSPVRRYLVEGGIILLLALATAIVNWKMIRDGINGMADLKWHIPWLQHFSKQLAEGIWYPRWLAGTNYGYGSPTFVFYAPLVYYIGSLLKFSCLNTEDTIIALFSLAIFLYGLNFYIYGRNRWGIFAAFVGALAYMTVPYIALDIYYRGGVASMFAQAWIPLIWWLTEKTLAKSKWGIGLAISWAMMALTHTASLLLCFIFWLPYTLIFLLHRSWKAVLATIIFAGIGLGMASLYLLPAIVEKSFVNTENMKEFLGGYRAALLGSGIPLFPLKITQLVNISYIFIHQLLAIAILTIIALVFCRKNKAIIRETWGWLAFAIAIAFMMSSLSTLIWQSSSMLQSVQFPWRLLQLFSFVGAALCGAVVSGILKLRSPFKLLLSLIIIGILLLNFRYSYKLSRQFITLRNPGKGSIAHLEYIKIALDDPYTDKLRDVREYRPLLKGGNSSPPEPLIGQPRVSLKSGKADIQIERWDSYYRRFEVIAKEPSTIRIRTYYYPAWHLYLNQKSHPIAMANDGTMELKLEPGSHEVELGYQWTPAFIAGMILSFLSAAALVFLWIKSSKIQIDNMRDKL